MIRPFRVTFAQHSRLVPTPVGFSKRNLVGR